MTKTRGQQVSERFTRQWQQCRDWLLPLMQNNQPKSLTKDELRVTAMRELKVSKSAFNMGWMAAIEDTGRRDWYEPLRKRQRLKSFRTESQFDAEVLRTCNLTYHRFLRGFSSSPSRGQHGKASTPVKRQSPKSPQPGGPFIAIGGALLLAGRASISQSQKRVERIRIEQEIGRDRQRGATIANISTPCRTILLVEGIIGFCNWLSVGQEIGRWCRYAPKLLVAHFAKSIDVPTVTTRPRERFVRFLLVARFREKRGCPIVFSRGSGEACVRLLIVAVAFLLLAERRLPSDHL